MSKTLEDDFYLLCFQLFLFFTHIGMIFYDLDDEYVYLAWLSLILEVIFVILTYFKVLNILYRMNGLNE